MEIRQITLGSTATQIAKATTHVQQIVFQNNSTHVMRIGDSTVSATKGLSIPAGGGSFNTGAYMEYAVDLSEWYVFGTATDVIDVLFVR